MASEMQPEYVNTTSSEVIAPPGSGPIVIVPPAADEEQWRRVGTQISDFLAELPDYLGNFFNEYKQPIISVGLIFGSIIAVKVVLAVLTALNDIPLLSPTFELVGISYSVWFINRYLLKASSRQELGQELQGLKGQVVGSQQLPEQG